MKNQMEKYNLQYNCGCIHEIENVNGLHSPTNNNFDFDDHKKNY